MCKKGDTTLLEITTLAGDYRGKEKKGKKQIDKCLAPLVKMLNEYGIKTCDCCCGHGKLKNSWIMIDPRNIHFEKVEHNGSITISLKFPYPSEVEE